jgi:hypothetical protein
MTIEAEGETQVGTVRLPVLRSSYCGGWTLSAPRSSGQREPLVTVVCKSSGRYNAAGDAAAQRPYPIE